MSHFASKIPSCCMSNLRNAMSLVLLLMSLSSVSHENFREKTTDSRSHVTVQNLWKPISVCQVMGTEGELLLALCAISGGNENW